MRMERFVRVMKMIGCGALLMQSTGCTVTTLEIIQTILLGFTAAGGIAIIQNI